ncbi:T9SS type A sorting domain-containing protein [uncultured Winogradskyella sp.]|uniref:T9SS type A sorting domain-containing protein n=1 Tax=uncultured Winogradskyella sp. TaxID=395353 RepID=UPI00261FCE5F|nr:T9SS type A sorting domain-containing protein [uncultured Winogradskyella sp.]
MKTKLLLTLALLISIATQAQTEFTYTGTGNWTDQANWSPSYPGDDGIYNPNYIINIDGDCIYNASENSFNTEINISGTLTLPPNSFYLYSYGNINLNGGAINLSSNTQINSSFLTAAFTGTGNINSFHTTPTTTLRILNDFIFSPGTTNSSGNISFTSSSGTQYIEINNAEFIFDIFSSNDFDTITGNGNDNTDGIFGEVKVNILNGGTFKHNDTFAIINNIDISFYENSTFSSIPPSGFISQFSLVTSSVNSTTGDIVYTLTDIESPTITNCPGNQNVTADCGIYYELPDYTTTPTATDNSTDSVIISQSIPAGVAVKDGAEITITATDAGGNSSSCTFTVNVTEETTLANDELDDIVSKNISLFPNPSSGQFTLKNTSGLNLTKGELIDVKGALIQAIDLEGFTDVQTIDLSALNPSIYFFKIYTADGVATKKIIIE